MPKYTPKLPLTLDNTQPGYEHLTDIEGVVKQNMKMILLTIPGERVMMPEFGVGIQELLFENFDDEITLGEFRGRINDQIKTYLPFVKVESVTFFESEVDMNKIAVQVEYFITPIGVQGEITL
jgi:phage baseplate assembly protein W